MNVRIIASTKPDFDLSEKDALMFSAHSSAICYMKGSLSDIMEEPQDKTLSRLEDNILKGTTQFLVTFTTACILSLYLKFWQCF